jgi:hypothetical protein
MLAERYIQIRHSSLAETETGSHASNMEAIDVCQQEIQNV